MKNLSKRHKIALVELLIVVVIALAFFCPRSLSGAMGGSFDPAEMTEVQILLQGTGDKAGDERAITLTPDQPAYSQLMDLLDSKLYFPYYINGKQRDITLDYWVTLLFTKADGRVHTYAFSGSRAIDTAGEGTRDRTFQMKDGLAFQQQVLDFLLGLEYTTGE